MLCCTQNTALIVTSNWSKLGKNCRLVQNMHKASGKNVKLTTSVQICPSLQMLHGYCGLPDSTHTKLQNSTGTT